MRLKQILPLLGAVLIWSAAPILSGAHKKATRNSSVRSLPSTANAAPSAGVKSKASPRSRKTSGKRGRWRRRARGQKAPTAERIREIQSALSREGVYEGEPSGKWDAASVAAMKRFQTADGLNPTGKLDALSLQKLGLGSQIAGLAPPRPPLPPPSAQSSTTSPPRPQ